MYAKHSAPHKWTTEELSKSMCVCACSCVYVCSRTCVCVFKLGMGPINTKSARMWNKLSEETVRNKMSLGLLHNLEKRLCAFFSDEHCNTEQ